MLLSAQLLKASDMLRQEGEMVNPALGRIRAYIRATLVVTWVTRVKYYMKQKGYVMVVIIHISQIWWYHKKAP